MVREVLEKDYEACLDIYNYYVLNTTNSFEEEEVTIEDFSNRIKEITKKFPWLVFEEDGKVLGYAYLSPYAKRSAYHISCDLSIYVDKDAHEKGIGKTLYETIEKIAVQMNYENMISIVCDENIPSKEFHEHLGFERSGYLKEVGYKFNRYIGIYFYKKKLV